MKNVKRFSFGPEAVLYFFRVLIASLLLVFLVIFSGCAGGPSAKKKGNAPELSAENSASAGTEETAPAAKDNADKTEQPGKEAPPKVKPQPPKAKPVPPKPKPQPPSSAPPENPLLQPPPEKPAVKKPALKASAVQPAPQTAPRPGKSAESQKSADTSENTGKKPFFPDPSAPARQMEGPGEISILLEGLAWVFRSDLSTPGNWQFLSRERENNSTRFDFRFPEEGHWNLVFTQQDLATGKENKTARRVDVGKDSGAGPLNGPSSKPGEKAVSGEFLSEPQQRFDAALQAAASGNIREAIALWEQDASKEDEDGRRARAAIVEEAVRSASPGLLVKWLEPYIQDGGNPETLSAALALLDNNAGYGKETTAALEALARWDNYPESAEWIYRLARQLEEPGENRNLDRAAELYRQIIDKWPLSRWRDLSEERILWLQRHYFRVR